MVQHMMGESWPLMINHLLATLFYKIDVILMEAINGVSVVGWYSTAYKWLDALQVIPAFLSAALLPVMSRQAQEDPLALVRSYRLAVKLLVMTALPIAVTTTFIAHALILMLGGPEFLPDGAIALQLMIWSIPIGWINSITQYVLIALDQQRILTRAFVVVVVFNVGANLIFLPTYSYRAAAVITILSETVLLILFMRVLAQTLRERLSQTGHKESVALWHILWQPILAAAVMLGVLALLWAVSGPLAVTAAVVVYLVVLMIVKPFDAAEREQLAPLVPGRLRARLGLPTSEA
jgi:O-antigen/teichoic acid export membrane protein